MPDQFDRPLKEATVLARLRALEGDGRPIEEQMAALIAAGHTVTSMARVYQASRKTLHDWLNRACLETPRQRRRGHGAPSNVRRPRISAD